MFLLEKLRGEQWAAYVSRIFTDFTICALGRCEVDPNCEVIGDDIKMCP